MKPQGNIPEKIKKKKENFMHKRFLSLVLLVLSATILLSCASRNDVCDTCINRTDERLLDAAAALYPDAVKSILSEGAHVNAKDSLGETALMKALRQPESQSIQSMRPMEETIRVLLDSGADFRTVNKRGISTLDLVQQTGDIHVIRLFGPRMRQSERDKMLMQALPAKQFAIAVYLLEKGANPKQVNAKKQTPLHFALNTSVPDPGLLAVLLETGNVNATDAYGANPLMIACANAAPVEIIKMLLEKGADLQSRINGNSLLWLALTAPNENIDLVKFLLAKGLDASERDPDGTPLLVLMAKADRIQSARALVEAGADAAVLDAAGAGEFRARLTP